MIKDNGGSRSGVQRRHFEYTEDCSKDDQARTEEKDLTAEWVWVNEEDIKIPMINYQ